MQSPVNPDPWADARSEIGNGRLSIIMPAYNLGSAIAGNIRRVHELFEPHLSIEIIPVDDGSRDNTAREIQNAASELYTVRPVYLKQNTGKGAALRAGFRASTGSHILLLDGDLDLPPDQVSGFFNIMKKQKADVVIGSKRHPDSKLNYPWPRVLISNVYYCFVKLLVGLPVKDTQTGIKLFKRAVLDWVVPRMLIKRFAFDLEILAIAHEQGYRVVEAPITMDFHSGFGCARPSVIRNVMNDTLAVFYRLRILRYYQSVPTTRMPEPHPLVSIIVAYPAPSPQLEQCLAGIARQDYKNYEVILLPDAPHPSSFSPQPAPQYTILPTGQLRPAEKRNIGIEKAKGSIVAFLDDDAYPTEDWLRKAVVHFFDDSIAAVGGPATTPPDDSFMATLGGRVYANRLVSGNYVYRYIPERFRNVEDYPSCNLFVRTETLRKLGGFRTEFWPGEDTYLCMEIVKTLGKRIVYDPWVHVYHHRRKLFFPHLRQIGRYALHRGYFARKFPATSRKLSYFIPSLFVLGLIGGALLSAVSPFCRILYLATLAVYAFLTCIFSVSSRPHVWLITWLGLFLTHIVYGARFLIGLIALRMPGEKQQFDHPSESTGSGE
jgi:glycosyltransferase involved in cell wall biosynthesis